MKTGMVVLAVVALGVGIFVGRGFDRADEQVIQPQPKITVATPKVTELSNSIDAMRRGAALNIEPESLPLARVENTDIKRGRAYPMQPPTIPHAIDSYQVDQNSNRCMLCHGQANAQNFQAPPVSVTHYMDRDGQVLAEISARRYFCVQCHVVQTDAPTLVDNGFVGADDILVPTAANGE